MLPTISVITICYNNLPELLITLASVDRQTVKPFEHWIIDGSSDEKIREHLQSHPQPVYRKWLSEKDEGIADAFNKGVRLSVGNVVNMLNSADHYFDEHILDVVSNAFDKDDSIMWLHGKYRVLRGGLWVTVGKRFEAGKLYRGMRSLSHQSMFVKRALHDTYGLYNVALKNAMDYDFVCRISREKFLFIDKPLVVFAPGGTTYLNYLPALREGRKVYESHFGYSFKLMVWQGRLKLLYYLLQSRIGNLLYRIKVWLKLENV